MWIVDRLLNMSSSLEAAYLLGFNYKHDLNLSVTMVVLFYGVRTSQMCSH